MISHATYHADRPLPSGVSIAQLLSATVYEIPKPLEKIEPKEENIEPVKEKGLAIKALKERVDRYSVVMKGKGWANENRISKRLGLAHGGARGSLSRLVDTCHVEKRKLFNGSVEYKWI